MSNKFVVSVADVYLYDKCAVGYWAPLNPDVTAGTAKLATRTALLAAKTLTDSSIETTVSNADTRGGFGNQLLNVYYHSAEMTINFTDAKFNLSAIKALVGDSAYAETGVGSNVITIESGYVPKKVEAVLVAKLAGETSAGCTGIIGTILIHVGVAALDGGVSISMTADGTATTPFKARALANGTPSVYAKIYELGASSVPTAAAMYQLVVLTATTYVASVFYTEALGVYTLETGAFDGGKTYYGKYDLAFAVRA